jgi:hypothetical protein
MAEPTVLSMINNNLTKLNEKVDGLVATSGKIEKKQENHDVRLNMVEQKMTELDNGQKKIKKDLYKHINSNNVSEAMGDGRTLRQKAWENKEKITISGFLISVALWLINNYPWS